MSGLQLLFVCKKKFANKLRANLFKNALGAVVDANTCPLNKRSSFLNLGLKKPKPVAFWSCLRSTGLWNSAWGTRWPHQPSIDCWHDTDGERWLRIRAIQNKMHRHKRNLKKIPETMAQAVEQNRLNLPLRVVIQDEARFGRLSDPRRCWAPVPLRPLVRVALVREYTYAYAAVSPQDGSLAWMLSAKMDTLNMNFF